MSTGYDYCFKNNILEAKLNDAGADHLERMILDFTESIMRAEEKAIVTSLPDEALIRLKHTVDQEVSRRQADGRPLPLPPSSDGVRHGGF